MLDAHQDMTETNLTVHPTNSSSVATEATDVAVEEAETKNIHEVYTFSPTVFDQITGSGMQPDDETSPTASDGEQGERQATAETEQQPDISETFGGNVSTECKQHTQRWTRIPALEIAAAHFHIQEKKKRKATFWID